MPESGESFEGKAVVVLGQGNAALETVQERKKWTVGSRKRFQRLFFPFLRMERVVCIGVLFGWFA